MSWFPLEGSNDSHTASNSMTQQLDTSLLQAQNDALLLDVQQLTEQVQLKR